MRTLIAVAVTLGIGPLPMFGQSPNLRQPIKPLERPADFILDKVDRLEGHLSLVTQRSTLGAEGGESDSDVSVNWAMFVMGADTTFTLFARYSARSWKFITGGESAMQFLIDGERMALDGIERPSRSTITGGVMETLPLKISPRQMHQLASAGKVYWRIGAERGFLEGDARPRDLEILRRFMVMLYPSTSGAPPR